MANPVKLTLERGNRAFGTMISAVTWPGVMDVLAADGWQFVVIDTEHSRIGPEALEALIRAGTQAGLVVLVRPADADYHLIARVLDLGAAGVMVPHVDSVAEAKAVAAATYYPPAGQRGVGCTAIALSPRPLAECLAEANESVLTAVMIESREAIEVADQIAAVEGVDVLVVGPADLSTEMGMPGQFDDPRFVAAVGRVIAAAEGAGKAAGIHFGATEPLGVWAGRGMRYLMCGNDVKMLASSSRAMAEEVRQIVRRGRGGDAG